MFLCVRAHVFQCVCSNVCAIYSKKALCRMVIVILISLWLSFWYLSDCHFDISLIVILISLIVILISLYLLLWYLWDCHFHIYVCYCDISVCYCNISLIVILISLCLLLWYLCLLLWNHSACHFDIYLIVTLIYLCLLFSLYILQFLQSIEWEDQIC